MRIFNVRCLAETTFDILSKPIYGLSVIKFKTLDDQSIQPLVRPKFRSDDRSPYSVEPESFKTQRDLEAFLREKNWIPVKRAGYWLIAAEDLYVIKLIKPYRALVQLMLKVYEIAVSGCILYFLGCVVLSFWKGGISWFQALPVDPYSALIMALVLGLLFNGRYELETGSPSLYRSHTTWDGLRIDGNGGYLPIKELIINSSSETPLLDDEKIELSTNEESYVLTDQFKVELAELVSNAEV